MAIFSIYVIGHRQFDLPVGTDDTYKRILAGQNVGAGGADTYLRDNTGENISQKNASYCELTACYWIWKNDTSSDYVGICHYRRYFQIEGHILRLEGITDIFEKGYQIILPRPILLKKENCMEFYIRGGGYKKDLNNLKKVISRKESEYLAAFDAVMNGGAASYSNMLICSKEIYDDYCVWLFGILFELEKITDISGYTQQEKRIYGYLSELLLNIYCKKNELKIKYLDIELLTNEKNKKVEVKKRVLQNMKNIVKHIIWFPSGVKPARRQES